MGRWGDGEMGRWGDGEVGRWGDGEMGRWGGGEMGRWGYRQAMQWPHGGFPHSRKAWLTMMIFSDASGATRGEFNSTTVSAPLPSRGGFPHERLHQDGNRE
ncbi:hypothetical protein [Moorena sp. SIO3I8]|uniref:hypothetical protein n=1 Tax=Moorena sp. SIO3I8 TaxID=2607833 RepID=UPI0013BF7908|nr:hypothetical protein [Moorena sp. SIO3I8]NEO07444.1 hypothetical protein [Moorena sp. SIO3I8]